MRKPTNGSGVSRSHARFMNVCNWLRRAAHPTGARSVSRKRKQMKPFFVSRSGSRRMKNFRFERRRETQLEHVRYSRDSIQPWLQTYSAERLLRLYKGDSKQRTSLGNRFISRAVLRRRRFENQSCRREETRSRVLDSGVDARTCRRIYRSTID